jgi:hypothetical protein
MSLENSSLEMSKEFALGSLEMYVNTVQLALIQFIKRFS